MGALVAAKLVPLFEASFRSVVMINPCLSLKEFFNREKNNKLFYKRFLKELKKAYHLKESELEETISKIEIGNYKQMPVPTKIIYCLHATPYSLQEHVRPYEQHCNVDKHTVDVSIFSSTKPYQELAIPIIEFLHLNEKHL